MITVYQVKCYGTEIKKVQFLSETKCFYVEENGRKTAKKSDYNNYFDSFDDAKTHLTIRTNGKIDSLKTQLDNKISELEEIRLLKEKELF